VVLGTLAAFQSIFITGHSGIPMFVQAKKAGAVDALSKPFRDQELLDSIQLALDKGSHQARKGKSSDSNCARASKR
jgi:FixJ family two-component response regulator